MALVVEYKDKRRQQEGEGDIFTAYKGQMAYLYIKIGRYYAKNLHQNGQMSFNDILFFYLYELSLIYYYMIW